MNARVSLDDDGTLDDFFAKDVTSVHFEALDESAWYATVTLPNGAVWHLHFGARNDRAKGYARAELVQEAPHVQHRFMGLLCDDCKEVVL